MINREIIQNKSLILIVGIFLTAIATILTLVISKSIIDKNTKTIPLLSEDQQLSPTPSIEDKSPTMTNNESDEEINDIQTATQSGFKNKSVNLKIVGYEYSPAKIVVGDEFIINFSITNDGSQESAGFWWEWWPTKFIYTCRKYIVRLAPGEIKQIQCNHTYNTVASYQTKLIIDPENIINESNESDNEKLLNFIIN